MRFDTDDHADKLESINHMTLRYHWEAVALLNHREYRLEPSPTARRTLDERERDIGIRLPCAVRGWYSLEDAVAVLAFYSNDDHPTSLDELGEEIERPEQMHGVEGVKGAEGRIAMLLLLTVLVENQSVCRWAVALDAGDDPPVYVGEERWQRPTKWTVCADRFSTWVYTRLWDYGKALLESDDREGLLLMAQTDALTADDLATLRRHFHEGPATHGSPDDRQLRFSSPDDKAYLLIIDGDERAGWFISADSDDGLERATRLVWTCGNLKDTLESVGERSQDMLDRLRR